MSDSCESPGAASEAATIALTTDMQAPFRRTMGDAVTLARQAEDHYERRVGQEAEQLVCLVHMARARRFCEAILALPPELAPEAQVIYRALFEHTTNLQWLYIKDFPNRAERFIRFEAVERSNLFKDTVLDDLPEEQRARIEEIEAAKQSVVALFRYRNRKGKLTWPEHSSRLKFRQRLDEVLTDRGEKDRIARIMATQYRFFSGMVHGVMHQLITLVHQDDSGRFSIKRGSINSRESLHVFPLSTACLLQILRISTEVLGAPSPEDLDVVRDAHLEALKSILSTTQTSGLPSTT